MATACAADDKDDASSFPGDLGVDVKADSARSPIDGGTYRFKLGWGAVERPLAWRRLSPTGDSLTAKAAGDSALLQRLSAIWSRLPLPLTTRLGPRLRRRISS